jgi:endonuclease/exonuclease/phosphatase (EEP) superfamily protein YafD
MKPRLSGLVIRPQWRRSGDTTITLISAVLGIAALLGAVVGLLAHQLDTAWQPMIIAAAAAHQLLWAAPVAVILFGLARRWSLLAAACLVLALAAFSQAPLYVGSTHPDAAHGITVLQANLKVGSADPTRLAAIVAAQHVDLLMTEELTPPERDRLIDAGLPDQLPYRFVGGLPGSGDDVAMWSRYPLLRRHNCRGFELGVLKASLQLSRGRTVSVFAVHLLPPYPYPAREWLMEMTRLRHLLAAAATRGGPVVVAGDFNATPDQAQFRGLLSAGYADAAEQVGAGYLSTYPTDRWFPPLIAIDHVLSRHAPADTVSTVDMPGSDHRALLAHLELPTPRSG